MIVNWYTAKIYAIETIKFLWKMWKYGLQKDMKTKCSPHAYIYNNNDDDEEVGKDGLYFFSNNRENYKILLKRLFFI